MKANFFSSDPEKETLDILRAKAEKELLAGGKNNGVAKEGDAATLFQELQLHQIELELQNDELRAANEELEQQQLKFAGIYNLAPVGYFILNNNGIIEEINHAGIELLEAGKAGITYKGLQSFIVPDDTDHYYRFYRQLLQQKEKQSCQLRMRSKSGREFHVQMEGIAINHPASKQVSCYIAVIDISERMLAVNKLAETTDRLELALEAAAAGTWELDPDTMAFYLDELNFHVCDIPADGFGGTYQAFLQLIHPEDRLMVDQHFRIAINHQKKIDVTCRTINSKNVLCHVSIRGHLVEEPDRPKMFAGIMMDISEKKRAEAEAEQARHNQQKIITSAIWYAQENERKRISDTLHDGVSQLLYGIKLKMNESDADNPDKNTDIKNLLNTAIAELRNISFELAPSLLADFGLPTTLAELAKRLSGSQQKINVKVSGIAKRVDQKLETGIYRIVQELINNSMKHSQATVIDIEVKKNKSIQISVTDNGHGFNVKKEEASPSGTGLSSIRNRISIYGGQLSISSAHGKGTKVKIILNP